MRVYQVYSMDTYSLQDYHNRWKAVAAIEQEERKTETLERRWQLLNYGDHFAWIIRIVAMVTWAAAIALGVWLCWRMWQSAKIDSAPGAGS